MSNKPPLPERINVKSQEMAKRVVRNFKKQDYNYREILKTKIYIKDKKFPLNIPKISQICNGSENQSAPKLTDADFFRLYASGTIPVYAVIILDCTFEEADAAFTKYQKYSKKILVSESFILNYFDIVEKVDPDEYSLEGGLKKIDRMVDYGLKLKHYTYPCDYCHEPIVFGDEEWKYARPLIIKEGFVHDSCFEKQKR